MVRIGKLTGTSSCFLTYTSVTTPAIADANSTSALSVDYSKWLTGNHVVAGPFVDL
jgi:hypothetical protein